MLERPGVFLGFGLVQVLQQSVFLSLRAIRFLGNNIQVHYFHDGRTPLDYNHESAFWSQTSFWEIAQSNKSSRVFRGIRSIDVNL
jgi:hypothetical protein